MVTVSGNSNPTNPTYPTNPTIPTNPTTINSGELTDKNRIINDAVEHSTIFVKTQQIRTSSRC